MLIAFRAVCMHSDCPLVVDGALRPLQHADYCVSSLLPHALLDFA